MTLLFLIMKVTKIKNNECDSSNNKSILNEITVCRKQSDVKILWNDNH